VKPLVLLAAAVLGASTATVLACGVCAEDKVAATYDYATIQRAGARGRTMVFCAIDGRYDAAKVKRAARQVRGVDGSTVRVSSELSAVSFALDTKAQSPQAAVSALQAEAPKGTKFKILKVIAP